VPSVSRWCVRCALLYLVAGMALGSWMLIQQARGHDPGGTWPVLHAHILLVGFLLLMIMGVAFWMFPRVQGTRPGVIGAWIAFAGVNAGLLLRVLAQPFVDNGYGQPWTALLELAAVLPTLGIIAFAATILPRVRAAMSPERARELRARVAGRED
jgi:hypothetical protein